MDRISAINDDPSMPLDSDSSNNDDSGNILMDLDSSSVQSQQVHCLNCGTNVSQRRSHSVTLTDVLSVFSQWTAPQMVESGSIVCHPCWTLALNESRSQPQPSTSAGRNRHLCGCCRSSLSRVRYHVLRPNNDNQIRQIITNWILPQQLTGTAHICHPCWLRANRALSRGHHDNEQQENILVVEHVPVIENVPEVFIELPHLSRAGETQSNCFVNGCTNVERLSVPIWLRLELFTVHNFYVPSTCRICRLHKENHDWDFLSENEHSHMFTARHIEDFASFLRVQKTEDWHNLDTIADDLFFYWVGLPKMQFEELKNSLPILNNTSYGTIALAAYLYKLRTGDSQERIASMMRIPPSTLHRYMNKARNALVADFLPRNLGISHISREDISSRNLLIPRELFGTNNQPIVIVDGTYIYVQKSSNYLYQKNTYSLHKYRNLVKPLIIVCYDGYIVDVLGPYPATTSDANIMLHEFNNEEQALRQYFQPGDVFILDRGFRDCISLLEECNYMPHMPASVARGESQLSTPAANQSRKVTLCRWIVEAVNGVMKKCFKIFRHEYFNDATNHVMVDFKIAAGLINKFHKRVTDREDASLILQRIREVEHLNNDLAEYVLANNLNRRRAHFNSLADSDVSFPTLTYSEMIIIACGTYQLKQARSYYQESLRENGTYIIEIGNGGNIPQELPWAANCDLIRGKIKSRHISRKMYYVYILYNNDINGIEAIKQYYCNCIVGRRTLGCCAHICTIIWYLGWARQQNNINLPAQHLDNVLIVYDDE